MISQTLKSQRLICSKSFSPQDPSLKNINPFDLNKILRGRGCIGCELGTQSNFIAPVVYRGNPESKVMLIGEAPGLYEDREGMPFIGPAGKLLDEIFNNVGYDTNRDFLISNVVFCRPVAPEGSGKQNLTPSEAHRAACRPYIAQVLSSVKPHTVGLLGAVAAKSILYLDKDIKMSDIVGNIYFSEEWPDIQFYVMYHPAYLLRARNDPKKQGMINRVIDQHLSEFIGIIKDMEE
jgi:uracil-DNA glycosylase